MIRPRAAAGVALCSLAVVRLAAHDGPPYPIVSDARSGAYTVSVWTDPDTTDDGSAGGQFWVMIATPHGNLPPATRVRVTAAPLDRPGAGQAAAAQPVRGDSATRFAAVVLDHEGRFRVRVEVDGPLGAAALEADVSATYDLRPPPFMLVLYLLPFLVVGGLWMRLLIRRRAAAPAGRRSASRGRA
jgi:hypothetical protein